MSTTTTLSELAAELIMARSHLRSLEDHRQRVMDTGGDGTLGELWDIDEAICSMQQQTEQLREQLRQAAA